MKNIYMDMSVPYAQLPKPTTDKALLEYNMRTYAEFSIGRVVSKIDDSYGHRDNFDPREDELPYDDLLHRISFEYLNLNVPYEALAIGRNEAELGLHVFRFMLSRKFITINEYKYIFDSYMQNAGIRKIDTAILRRLNRFDPDGDSYDYFNLSIPFWDLAEPRTDDERKIFMLRWESYCQMVKQLGGYIHGTHVYGEYANGGMSIG